MTTQIDETEPIFWYLSTRIIRRAGDPEWEGYINFIGLPHLLSIRTIDSWCNPHATGSSNHCLFSLEQIDEALENLPTPIRGQQYYLLFVDAESLDISELMHPRLKLLGYDLSDETRTSSLLNCGRWTGVLVPIAQRVNQYGLLNLEDALKAQALLPEAWNYDHHADVTIWALLEVD